MTAPAAELDTDTLIMGAGAAGLAAAAELSARGASAMILEARDRIGGRVFTSVDVRTGIRIELGAEFLHGRSDTARDWLAATGTTIVDADRTTRVLASGTLALAERRFERMMRDIAKLRRPGRDLPFADFMQRAGRALPTRSRRLALAIVEGFDAADASRVSTAETLEVWAGTAAVDAPTFRPRDGYAAMLEAIRARLDSRHVDLRLGCVVHEVRWQRGRVQATATWHGRPITVTARRAVITLPVGVLQGPPGLPGAVRFEPALRRKRPILAQLAMGAALKVVLSFDEPFWEIVDAGRYRDTAFFLRPDAAFPTFWTTLPVRSSILVAWAGGPKALRLGDLAESDVVDKALDALDGLFGRRVSSRDLLRASYVHDWQCDSFARGAYSYVVAGGGAARQRLAAPIEDTLYFAGEATDTSGEAATVIGALRSGQHAARRILGRGG